MFQKIAHWLHNADRDYNEGLEIYLTLRKDRQYDNYFNSNKHAAKSDYAFQLLHKEVHRLFRIHGEDLKTKIVAQPITVRQTPVRAPKKEQLPSNKPRIHDNPHIDIRELPEDLKALFIQNKSIRPEMERTHLKLKDTSLNDEQRKELANKLLEMEAKSRQNWDRIDTWYKNKDNPKTTENEPQKMMSVVEMKDRLYLLENYVRRYRTEVAKAKNEIQKAKKQAHLDKYTQELDEVKAKLNNIA